MLHGYLLIPVGNSEVESRDDGGYGGGNVSPQLKISEGSVRSTIKGIIHVVLKATRVRTQSSLVFLEIE